MAIGWGQDGWNVDGYGGVTSVSATVSGVSAVATPGAEAVKNENFIEVTGVSAEGLIGAETAATNRSWGIGDWGQSQLGWGGASLDSETSVTGVSAQGLLGEESNRAIANVDVTGVSGTPELGVVTFQNQQNLNVQGFELSLTLGDPNIIGTGNVSPTGVEAIGEEGTVAEVTGEVLVFPTGLSAISSAGDPTITGTANFSVTAVTGIMGLGNEIPRAGADVDVTGVGASGSVDTVEVAINQTIRPIGFSATATIDSPLVWGGINTSQTPNWVEIDTNAA